MCITLYSNDDCSFCTRAKQLLERRCLRYREVDLAMDEAGREELVRRTGRMTFPQVLVDCQPIGGFRELQEFVRTVGASPCG
jgi:glutaredoxin 3